MTSKPGTPLLGVTYVHSYGSHQTQLISSCSSSHISATHNLYISSRTSPYRQDIQSSYLLDHLHYQRKIPCTTEKSHKILGKEIWQERQVELEHALFLPLEEGLSKYVATVHALSLSHVYMYTHTVSFFLGKPTFAFLPQNCWLNTESSTATRHKSACIPPIPELRTRKKQLHVTYEPALHAFIWQYFVSSRYKIQPC